MEFIDACRKIIEIDSTASSGTREITEFVAEFAKSRQLKIRKIEGFHGGQEQANILIHPGIVTESVGLFQGHLDTVEPGHFGIWSRSGRSPFEAVIDEDRIYGLGAADCKLDLICKIEALAKYKDKKFSVTPVVCGTHSREQGMTGAVQLIRRGRLNIDFAFVGDATDLGLVQSGKGVANIQLRIPLSEAELEYRHRHDRAESASTESEIFAGRAGSTTRPEDGENAIVKMLEFLNTIRSEATVMDIDGGSHINVIPAQAFLEYTRDDHIEDSIIDKLIQVHERLKALVGRFQEYQDDDFNPSYSTLNPTLIRSDEDHVFLAGSCRLVPSVTQDIADAWMQEVREVCESVGGSFRMSEFKRPFRANPDSRVYSVASKILQEMEINPKADAFAKTNEANVFNRFGIDTIIFGPGDVVSNVSTPNENVAIEDLRQAREFYEKCIEGMCL